MSKIKTAEQILDEANFFTGEEEMEAILSLMETYADQFRGKQEVKNLAQPDVSGRSKLLLAFGKFIDDDCHLLGTGYIEEIVKKFEASNSH